MPVISPVCASNIFILASDSDIKQIDLPQKNRQSSLVFKTSVSIHFDVVFKIVLFNLKGRQAT